MTLHPPQFPTYTTEYPRGSTTMHTDKNIRLDCHLVEGDEVAFEYVARSDRFLVDAINYAEGESEVTHVWLTRSQAHEVHAWLTTHLGLSTPAPKAPLTASRASAGTAKASRNWDVV